MSYTVYLKITGIPGESRDPAHENWIELQNFSQTTARPEGGPGDPLYQDFHVSKMADRATPLLALACSEGWRVREAVLELCRRDGAHKKFMEIRMFDVTVASFAVSGGPDGHSPTPYESLSLRYAKIEWRYDPAVIRPEEEFPPVTTSWTSDEYREPEKTTRKRTSR